VYAFLRSVFQAPSSQEFQCQLDEPGYEPRDRLVVRQAGRVVSHLRLLRREMWFGASSLPITTVADVATAPEFRRRGCASALLAVAQRRIRSEGSVLGLLRTREIDFYRRRGWTVCGRHSYWLVAPQGILCRLHDRPAASAGLVGTRRRSSKPLHIRYWRRVEQDALRRLYDDGASQAYGALERTEAVWHWLVGRRAYDQVYVALHDSPESDLDAQQSRIVGYAVVKSSRIVELIAPARRPEVAEQLVARVCGDAMEGQRHELRLDCPPNHPLHGLLCDAGGRHHGCTIDDGYAYMVYVADLPKMIGLLHAEFLQRAAQLQWSLPLELGLLLSGEAYTLQITADSTRLVAGPAGRCCLCCRPDQLVRLLLGQIDVRAAIDRRELVVANRRAARLAAGLFPVLPLWYPVFDDLPC
jgi:GNAT superfamily N-acetyltransferase